MSQYDQTQNAARKYTKDHHIQELLAHLLQLVIFHRPEDPRKFMRDELEKIKKNQGTPSDLFTSEDLQTMFEMIDVTRQRHISKQQLRNACKNVSAGGGNDEAGIDAAITSIPSENVGPTEFATVLGAQLQTKNHWKK
jgi:hypothetical protein